MSMEKKNKRRINIIDVVIILLVIALIAVGIYRLRLAITSDVSARRSGLILTFESEVAYDSILDYLNDGDEVYLMSDGTLLGYIHDRTSDDDVKAVYEIVDEEQGFGLAGKNKTIRGCLMLSDDVLEAQNGDYYVLGDTNLTVGSRLKVYTEKVEITVIVKEIS